MWGHRATLEGSEGSWRCLTEARWARGGPMAEGFDRRRFIKACAGIGAAGAAAAAGIGMLRPLTDMDVEIIPIDYPGIHVLRGSPAPYGLPLIPLEITGDGEMRGVPDAFEDQLQWYRYCGHERTPGAQPDWGDDDLLRYHVTAEQRAGLDSWYAPAIDEVIQWEDMPENTPEAIFRDYPGVGAPFRWRSEGQPPEETLTGILLRAPVDELEFTEGILPDREEELLEWMPEHPDDPDSRLMACLSICTHFCCVARFHEDRLAEQSGWGDKIFCTCHLSRYEPFLIDQYHRTIFRYPDEVPEETPEPQPA